MKKEYIKPVMESEMFVANEYISTCWLVTCVTERENFTTKTKPIENYNMNPNSEDPDGYVKGFTYNPIRSQTYYNNRNNEFTHVGHIYNENSPYDWANGWHEVKIQEVDSNGTGGTLTSGKKYGPNAS